MTPLRQYIVSCFALLASLLLAQPAHATLISFNDYTAWQTAVGTSTLTEDFNSFAVDTEFRTTSVALNNMVVSGTTGVNGTVTQKIDALPLEFRGYYDIDGTTQLLADLRGTAEYVRFDFLTPVVAWGAMTKGLANEGPSVRDTELQVYDASNNLLGTIFPSSDNSNAQQIFYGFQLTSGAAAHLLFADNDVIPTNDVFSVDNIEFVPVHVPEPASLLLFGTGLAVAGVRRYRQRK